MISVPVRIGRVVVALLSCVLLVVAARAASAQALDAATIRGRVLDQTGAGIPAVAVTATNAETGQTRQTSTDQGGYYSLPGLPLAGEYQVAFAKSGFADKTVGHVGLRAGETADVNVTLLASGGTSQVTVYGTTSGIRSDTAQIGTRLDAQKIQNTPLVGHALTSLALLDSAVRPSVSTGDIFLGNTLFVVDGAGRRQTTFTVDGANANDSWGRQTIFANVPVDAVQEFTVLTNGFSAEYGRTSGAAVTVVTKSGTNTVRGDLLGLWMPGGLESPAPLQNNANNDRLGDGAFTVGGPLVKDRTYYFAAGEYNYSRRDSTITSPIAPGVYTGTGKRALFEGRLDHQLTPNNRLTAVMNLDRYSNTNPNDAVGGLNLPSAGRVFSRNGYTGQVSATSVLSDSMLNEVRFGVQWAAPITEFTPISPSTQYVRPGVGTSGESRSTLLTNHQFELKDTLTLSHGRHDLKVGLDAVHSNSGGNGTEFGAAFSLGQFTLKPGDTTPVEDLTAADIQRYQQSFGNASYMVQEWLWSAFAQDNVTVRPDLTLNLGLRYDRQTFTDDTKMWSPRVGFAYNLKGDPRTVVRGSFGLYHSEIPANFAANWFINGPEGLFTFSAAPGQLGFPSNLQPLAALPAGSVLPPRDIDVRPGEAAYLSQFFDVSKLKDYPDALLNPWTRQMTVGIEHELGTGWFASADYVHAHTADIVRPLDANSPAPFVRTAPGQVRSAAAADATRPITPTPNGYRIITTFVNDGLADYDSLQLNLSKHFARGLSFLASYTFSNSTDTVDPDVPQQDPNDPNFTGEIERGPNILNERHRFVLSGAWQLPVVTVGGVGSFGSGLPFDPTTGVDNNGDGSPRSDRPIIDGQLAVRNSGTGTPLYDVAPFVERAVGIGSGMRLQFRAEAFNLFNHANIYAYNGVYGNNSDGQPIAGYGQPKGGISSVGPGREFQFLVKLIF
ncbi:MAG TPA: TonB-dependent receptor [Vicinamibacterales bacterium]|jgi:outer membrane receptor protein involved in Fe transport